MADRLVIVLQRALDGPPRILLEEPNTDPQFEESVNLSPNEQCKSLLAKMKEGPWAPALVEEVGKLLCDCLKKQPAIQRDFVTRLNPNAQAGGPIYLRIEEPELEMWPWETLNDSEVGFLAQR
jgi:hypothetical protein